MLVSCQRQLLSHCRLKVPLVYDSGNSQSKSQYYVEEEHAVSLILIQFLHARPGYWFSGIVARREIGLKISG